MQGLSFISCLPQNQAKQAFFHYRGSGHQQEDLRRQRTSGDSTLCRRCAVRQKLSGGNSSVPIPIAQGGNTLYFEMCRTRKHLPQATESQCTGLGRMFPLAGSIPQAEISCLLLIHRLLSSAFPARCPFRLPCSWRMFITWGPFPAWALPCAVLSTGKPALCAAPTRDDAASPPRPSLDPSQLPYPVLSICVLSQTPQLRESLYTLGVIFIVCLFYGSWYFTYFDDFCVLLTSSCLLIII